MPRGNQENSQTTKATLGLRELLLSGAFKPRERVPELRLVEELGVSRTPLRIALMTLEHEGLLETLSGGGFVVREFTRTDIDDAIELRGVLEGTAARFAAERLNSEDELEPLREVLYGVFIIVIFLGFRRGVVYAVVKLVRRLIPARPTPPDPQPSGE